MQIRQKVLTGVLTGALTASVALTAMLMPTEQVYAEYVVDFSQGDYSTWDGVSYTFGWYENPSIDADGGTVYTISSASDLAGLAVVSNNVSDASFAWVTGNIAEEDRAFITTVDDFEGDIIKLDCNIDLADFEWLPIGFPWHTLALSASTDLVNTAGETVRYNAIDYITEDDTVDPWVGDENGDPISTRYWEYPESELRFRDLMNTVTFDGLHNLIQTEIPNSPVASNDGSDLPVGGHWESGLGNGNVRLSYFWDVINNPNGGGGSYIKVFDYGTPTTALSALTIEDVDLSQNVMVPYTYKSIKGYTETKGFAGIFDGQNHNIKGLAPSSRWASGEEALNTYDPIARGLFSVLDEAGIIKDLNVKGGYHGSVMSYSAVLCAYNYGVIERCYVDGDVQQGLLHMLYPIARDYAPNGNSQYLLSSSEGTVMPVGNSGFMTSQNYGTIKDSYTVGACTQVFRQFGFFASTNYGSIDGCENRASLSNSAVTTDFHTDEWSNSTNTTYVTARNVARNGNLTISSPLPTVGDSSVLQPKHSSFAEMYDTYLQDTMLHYIAFTSAGVSLYHGPAIVDNFEAYKLWIPALYNTAVDESIAANHLYGQYIAVVFGGITAVNEGTIQDCVNKGEIAAGGNIRAFDTPFSVYDTEKTLNDYDDVYSYIRPGYSYGLFSTSNVTLDAIGGIAGVNFGIMRHVTNTADLRVGGTAGADTTAVLSHDLDFSPILATANGFYQNDVMYNGEPYLWGTRWWVTEDNPNQGIDFLAEDGITSAAFDRNMPYPFYKPNYGRSYGYRAGITAYNMGSISTADNTGAANYNICGCTIADESHDNPSISNVYNTTSQIIAACAFNTDFDNITTTNRMVATIVKQTGDYEVSLSNINLIDVVDTCGYGFDADLSYDIDTVSLAYKIDGENRERFTLNTVAASEPLAYTVNGITCEDVYMKRQFAGASVDNIAITNMYSNSSDNGAIADFIKGSDFENIAVVSTGFNKAIFGITENCTITDFVVNCNNSEVGLVGNAALGTFYGCELTDVEVFGNNASIGASNCTITNLLTRGFISLGTGLDGSAAGFVYNFSNCVCTDVYLESDTNFEWKAPIITGKIQNIPGFLQAKGADNIFTRCAIVTPDGALSFPTLNTTDVKDEDRPDAKLVYVKGAAENGGLAYYLDKGYSDNRTFDYTVAKNDTRSYGDYLPSSVEMYLDENKINEIKTTTELPTYTRKKIAVDEPSFYRVSVPYVGLGAGEVKVSLERDGQTQSTEAEGKIFPKTDLFVLPGEVLNFDIVANDGFELSGLTWVTRSETIELKSTSPNTEVYTFASAEAPAEDVQILANWSNVWAIEISDDCTEWLTIEPSAVGAAAGRVINLRMTVLDDRYAVGSVYYYPYKKQGSNDWVLDTSEKYPIDLTKASFEMPNASVRIYAEAIGNTAEMLDVVIAGTHGQIDGNGMVYVKLDNSIDITNLCIDSVQLSEGATISPAIDVPQNFSKPVEYTVKSSSGIEKKYIINVISTTDGDISLFELKGRMGVIDPEAGTITVTLPEGEDVSSVTPYIVWTGTAITPDATAPQDFTQMVAYTVTASNGSTKTYTIVLDFVAYDSAIQTLTLKVGDMALPYEVDDTRGVITVTYPYDYDVTEVQLAEFNYAGESANITRGEYLNLTKTNRILIVDEHGATKDYRLVAIEAKNPAKKITQFVLFGVEGVIDEEAGTIMLNIPKKYDVTAIAPDIISFIGASVEDASIARDFTQPVTYTVHSYTGEIKTYTVVVNRV